MDNYWTVATIWVLGAAVCGYIAQTKGRHPGLWMGAALLASPVLIGIIVLVVSPIRHPREHQ